MRRTIALITTALLVALAGCSSDDGGDTGSAPASDESSDDEVEVNIDLDDYDEEDVLLSVRTGGGYVPEFSTADDFPEFLLLGDGTVIQEADIDADVGQIAPFLETAQLEEAAVEQVIQDALDAGVGEDDDEFGEPEITDLATTVIEIDTEEVSEELALYALGDDEGLSDDEEDARDEIEDFLDDLQSFEGIDEGDIDGPEEFEPEAWLVSTQIAVDSPSSGPGEADALLVEEWPLEPERAASDDEDLVCTEATDGEAELVADVIGQAQPGTQFEVDGDQLVDASLRPVLTGDEDCGDLDGFSER